MTKEVLVSIKGTQCMDGEDDSIEIITAGTCYNKNGKWYVLYDEAVEGIEAATHNTVKIAKDKIEVIKKGLVDSRMVYEYGKKHNCNYVTPMGLIILGITTTALTVTEQEDRLEVLIEYSLEMNGEYVAGCRLELHAASAGQDRVLKLAGERAEIL